MPAAKPKKKGSLKDPSVSFTPQCFLQVLSSAVEDLSGQLIFLSPFTFTLKFTLILSARMSSKRVMVNLSFLSIQWK